MAQQKNGRGHEMDLLKSILETEGDDRTESDHVRLHLPSMSAERAPQKTVPVSPRHRPPIPQKRDIAESDTEASSLESELWMQKEINKAYKELHAREQQDSPRGSITGKKRGRKKPVKKYNGVLSHADMLENKYQELRGLLQDRSFNKNNKLDQNLVHQTRQLMKQYEMVHGGKLPVEKILGQPGRHPQDDDDDENNFSHSTQTDPPSWKPSMKDDDNTYILIDGTGSYVRTRRVTFKDDVDGDEDATPTKPPIHTAKPAKPAKATPMRGRSAKRKARPTSATRKSGKSKSPASKSSTEKSSKSRSVSPSDSDSYSTDFSSRSSSGSRSPSRSRSRSRSADARALLDHHLKTTDNPKLQDWLKQKNKQYRLHRKEERKKRRAERMKAEADAEEKEKKKQVSEQRVRKWMSEKRKEARLLRRERIAQGLVSDPSVQSDTTVNSEPPLDSDRSLSSQQQTATKRNAKYKQEKPVLTDLNRKPRPLSASFVYTPKKTVRQRPSSSRPAPKKAPPEEDTEEAKRASYNQWVEENEGPESNMDVEKEKEDVPNAEEEKPEPVKRVKARKGSNGDYTLPRQSATNLPPQSKVVKDSESVASDPQSPSSPSFAVPHPPRPSISSPLPPKLTGPPTEVPPAGTEAPPNPTEAEAPDKDLPPRPQTSMSSRRVKYTEKSWENFADHVWEKLNEDDEAALKNGQDDQHERPEPQGSDCPDDAPFCESEGASLSSDPPSPADDAEDELAKLKGDEDDGPVPTADDAPLMKSGSPPASPTAATPPSPTDTAPVTENGVDRPTSAVPSSPTAAEQVKDRPDSADDVFLAQGESKLVTGPDSESPVSGADHTDSEPVSTVNETPPPSSAFLTESPEAS